MQPSAPQLTQRSARTSLPAAHSWPGPCYWALWTLAIGTQSDTLVVVVLLLVSETKTEKERDGMLFFKS